MHINLSTKQDLLNLIDMAGEQYNLLKTEKERVAMLNYIGHLYQGLNFIDDEVISFSLKKLAGGHKGEAHFLTKHNALFNRWCKNFVFNKSFHNEYIGECLDACEEIYDQVIDEARSYESEHFTKDDYWEIFFEFTKSLGQTKEFDRYIKNGNIFDTINGFKNNFLGMTSVNPKDGISSIFLDNFSYDLSTMITNAHEFGHCVDFGMIFDHGSINTFNKLDYYSVYDEAISRLYEKLLLSFLNKNNIMIYGVRDKFYDMVDLHHDYLLTVLLFTFLDDNYLVHENYKKLASDEFYDLVKEYIPNSVGIDSFIEEGEMDLFCDTSYAYGGIIASFLQHDINEYGEFNSPLMRNFLSTRADFFDRNFIEENDLSPKKYRKIYQKELDLMKNV